MALRPAWPHRPPDPALQEIRWGPPMSKMPNSLSVSPLSWGVGTTDIREALAAQDAHPDSRRALGPRLERHMLVIHVGSSRGVVASHHSAQGWHKRSSGARAERGHGAWVALLSAGALPSGADGAPRAVAPLACAPGTPTLPLLCPTISEDYARSYVRGYSLRSLQQRFLRHVILYLI